MTDRIEPALTAEEWREKVAWMDPYRVGVSVGITPNGVVEIDDDDYYSGFTRTMSRPAALIALANAALPDSDPRKITLGTVLELRRWAEFVAIGMKDSGYKHEVVQANFDQMRDFADALSSYLPPEVP